MEDVVHRMNEGYRAWGALKNVLGDRGLVINSVGSTDNRDQVMNRLETAPGHNDVINAYMSCGKW